jgi:hypothetical protein
MSTETHEERRLLDRCRDELIGPRLHYEDRARRNLISSRDAMEHDVTIQRARQSILRHLQDILDGPDHWAVSASKARQIRSIARGALGKKELTLRVPPTKTSYNRRTGVAKATHRYGQKTYTNTYTPVKVKR